MAQASLLCCYLFFLTSTNTCQVSHAWLHYNGFSHHLSALSQPQSLKRRTLIYLLNIIRRVICIQIYSLLIFFKTPSSPKLYIVEMVHLPTPTFRLLTILLSICYTATEQLGFFKKAQGTRPASLQSWLFWGGKHLWELFLYMVSY